MGTFKHAHLEGRLAHPKRQAFRPGGKAGLGLVGLFLYCVLLTGLAAAFASAFVIGAYWIFPAP